MKLRVAALIVICTLSSCMQQGLPDWEDVPGAECSLVAHRLHLPLADAAAPNHQGKPVRLRDSETEQLRNYLRMFTEQGDVSVVSYAPATVLYGEYFSLNYRQDIVVLNIGRGERTQYVRPITQADKDMLKLLRKRSDSRTLKP